MTKTLSVSELTSQIKATLCHTFLNVSVEGEISNLTNHQSGHSYFTLKDEKSSIKCVIFKSNKARLKIILQQNLSVKVDGNISVYEQKGEYQIICANITQGGIGNLALKYEELKNTLYKKGYFDEKYKKKIPLFPKKIALLTSQSGAVIHDMQMIAKKRWNLVELVLIDTIVQGNEAKNNIANNIKFADKEEFDIIVLARGGGSIEDLWAFNEEIVIEAIFNTKTPIVSAIGHEVDYMLSDFVADLRAPTPSACMELILPDKNEWILRLSEMQEILHFTQKNNLNIKQKTIEGLQEKLEFFKIDFYKINKELNELNEFLDKIKSLFIKSKLNVLNNLSGILENTFSNFLQVKSRYIPLVRENLQNSTIIFVNSKNAILIHRNLLDSSAQRFLLTKQNTLNSYKEMLNNPSTMCKNGYVQISINNKIKTLSELKIGDKITLYDGKTSKEAIII